MKKYELIMGKQVGKTILNHLGRLVVEEGTIITPEVIDHVNAADGKYFSSYIAQLIVYAR